MCPIISISVQLLILTSEEQEGEEVKPDLVRLDALAEKLRQKLSRKMREEDATLILLSVLPIKGFESHLRV